MPLRTSGQWQAACSVQPCVSVGSPALLSCPLDYPSAWQVFFHFMSSQWLAGFVIHTFHKVSVLYFIAFEANKSELTCYHKLGVLPLAQIPFFLSRSSMGDFCREGLLRKWRQQFKKLQLGLILGIDSGTLQEKDAPWRIWADFLGRMSVTNQWI